MDIAVAHCSTYLTSLNEYETNHITILSLKFTQLAKHLQRNDAQSSSLFPFKCPFLFPVLCTWILESLTRFHTKKHRLNIAIVDNNITLCSIKDNKQNKTKQNKTKEKNKVGQIYVGQIGYSPVRNTYPLITHVIFDLKIALVMLVLSHEIVGIRCRHTSYGILAL